MTNFPRNSAKHGILKLFGLILLISAITALPQLRAMISGGALKVATPVSQALRQLGSLILRPFDYLGSLEKLKVENRDLRRQKQLLLEERLQTQVLREENLRLMTGQGRSDEPQTSTPVGPSLFFGREPHLALIVSRPVRSYYDTLIIDQGLEDGIRPGMTVFSAGGVLLGEIELTLENQARVVLLSSAGRKTEVLIGTKPLSATAEGVGGGNLRVLIPHGSSIRVGDSVTALHAEPWLLGKVGAVDESAKNTLVPVLIKSPVNFQEIKWVVVTSERLLVSELDHVEPKITR